MSDHLDKLKTDVETAPTNSSDFSIITSVSVNEYNDNKLLLDTMYNTCSILKANAISAVNLVDANYVTIINKLNDLNAISKNKKPFDYKMDKSLDVTASMTKEEQVRFLGSTTEAVFNMIQLFKIHDPDEPLDMPTSIANSIDKSLNRSKDEVLEIEMGTLYADILFPFIEYQKFLDSNNILSFVEKLTNIELFLIPKYFSPDNYIQGNVLFSQYYSELFLIDSEGKLNIDLLSSDTDIVSKLHNIITNIESYYK